MRHKENPFIGYGSSTSLPKEDAHFHTVAMGLDPEQEQLALERAREQHLTQSEALATVLCEQGDTSRASSVLLMLLGAMPHHERAPHWRTWLQRLDI